MRRCIDCNFWWGRYSCRECGKPLCGVCIDWPSPRLHSLGKGLCTACRAKTLDITFPIGGSGVISGKSNIQHWATILDIVEHGIEGNTQLCRDYAELWLEKLQADGETTISKHLQHLLEGRKGQVIHLANITKGSPEAD